MTPSAGDIFLADARDEQRRRVLVVSDARFHRATERAIVAPSIATIDRGRVAVAPGCGGAICRRLLDNAAARPAPRRSRTRRRRHTATSAPSDHYVAVRCIPPLADRRHANRQRASGRGHAGPRWSDATPDRGASPASAPVEGSHVPAAAVRTEPRLWARVTHAAEAASDCRSVWLRSVDALAVCVRACVSRLGGCRRATRD